MPVSRYWFTLCVSRGVWATAWISIASCPSTPSPGSVSPSTT
ncbi:hypothetical protein N7U49_35635 [Streptomyces sp. AD2-2]|nr:hypothetical protein N7U49_35635 [Streptomyces sp. AD2-2]